MSNKSRIVAVTEQIKTNNIAIGQMKIKLDNLAQVTAAPADVAAGKTFGLPTGAVGTGTATLYKPEQAKTTALALANGDQTIAPDSGMVLTAVTVTKPATLLPENIKQGVNIGGVLGTLTGAVTGAVLSSIAITTPPTKLAYNAGDAFDPAGMVVTATYSNGATRTVTGCTYAPSAMTASGNVIVSFTESGVTKTAAVTVTVATAQVYAPQSATAGMSLVGQAMIDNDGVEDTDESAILIKLREVWAIQGRTYRYLAPSGFVLAAFYSGALVPAQYNKVSVMLDNVKTYFIAQANTYGSVKALFTDPAAKSFFSGTALTEVKAVARECLCTLTTDIENFTFTLCDRKGGNRRSGSIYELFFDAKLV